MSGAALAALILGASGIGGLLSTAVNAWMAKRNAERDDRKEDREDERFDLEALVKTNERLLATVDSYRLESARIERLEDTVNRQGVRIAELEAREAECQRKLEAANRRIDGLLAR